MESITAQINRKWFVRNETSNNQSRVIKNLGSVNSAAVSVPRGTFGTWDGDGYLPTVHGYPGDLINKNVVVSLETTSLSAPAQLGYVPGHPYMLLNTGCSILQTGDSFTVEMPTPEESKCQIAAAARLRPKTSVGEIDRATPLLGGFLAVRRMDGGYIDHLKHRLERDVDLGGKAGEGLVLSVAMAARHLRGIPEDATVQLERAISSPVAEDIRGLLKNEEAMRGVKKAMNSMADLVASVNWATYGKVLGSEYATVTSSRKGTGIHPMEGFRGVVCQFSGF